MATQTHLGLEITDSGVKYFELLKNKNSFEIGYFGSLPLPQGVIEDGSIRDKARLKNILSSIRAKGKWRDVTVSHMPDQVFLADILEESGFKDIYFESSGEAVARASILEGSTETDMIVYFSGDKMDICAGPRPRMRLLATFDFPSAIFEQMRDKEIIYSFIKGKIDEQYISWHTHKDPFDSAQGRQRQRPKIKKIIISGEMPNGDELADYLGRNLKLKVELSQVWQNIFSFENYIPVINFRESLRNSAAIGLALRGFEK